MWLAEPVYEALPLCYAVGGLGMLAVSAILPVGGWWTEGLFAAGLALLAAGLVLHLKRRGYRSSRSRKRLTEPD